MRPLLRLEGEENRPDREKTPFYQRFYNAMPHDTHIPSTLLVYQQAPSNLLMPAEVPNPSGAPRKRRIPAASERRSSPGRGSPGRGGRTSGKGRGGGSPGRGGSKGGGKGGGSKGGGKGGATGRGGRLAGGISKRVPQRKPRVAYCHNCGAVGHYQKTCKAGAPPSLS